MNAKELAGRLHEMEFTDKFPHGLLDAAKQAGLVVLTGPMAHFFGAIEGEVICEAGGPVYIDGKGILPDYDSIDNEAEADARDYFDRKRLAVRIDVECNPTWSDRWSYSTAIPHATFKVLDDGCPYIRGIVFALADIAPAA